VKIETRLTVDLGERAYPILIGSGLLADAAKHIMDVLKPSHVAVVTHRGMMDFESIASQISGMTHGFRAAGIPSSVILVPKDSADKDEMTEKRKSFKDLQHILDEMLGHAYSRQTCVVAFGGGVIGDLVGFAAAIYLRGVSFVQIPTTLLAMVDASVGGKTGINTEHGKNLVGAFWQPRLVLADLDILETLPTRELHAGMAEVIKHGVIADAALFERLKMEASLGSPSKELLEFAVKRSCEIKAAIVAEDERESGKRMILNYGHTVGHALENAIGQYTVPHGEWVSIGMVAEAEIARDLGESDDQLPRKVEALCNQAGLPTTLAQIPVGDASQAIVAPAPWEKLLTALRRDKKATADRLRFVLPTRIGEVIIRDDVPLDVVERAFRARGATD
jgi:3-dehydroquinate synthase